MMKLQLLLVCCCVLVAAVTAADEGENTPNPAGSVLEHPNGLVVKVIKESKKCLKKATPGDHLSVHYVGRLDDENGKIFDESRPRGQEFNFQLGAGQVIQGYEQGVPGMCLGETRTLTVPASLGYGAHGVAGVIPGDSTLHFTVELMNVKSGKLRTLSPGMSIPGAGGDEL